MYKSFLTLLLIFIFHINLIAQDEDDGHIKHHHFVISIGQSGIPTVDELDVTNNFSIVPTWGFNYEFLFNKHLGLGLKNDIELSKYVIEGNDEAKIERETPISSSIIILYNPIEGLGVFFGPGIEFEPEENFYILSFGISYEWELPKYFDISPEISYELKNGHTGAISFALAVGYRIGKG